MKLFNVIKKNIKLLLRNKISTFVLVFGPLLIIFLVGFSFSTNSFNLRVSIFSEEYSPLSESLINVMKENNYFIMREDSENSCMSSVKQSTTQACIIFPKNMKISNENKQIVKLYVDQSKINIAYLVISTLTESLGQRSTEITKDLTDKIVSGLIFSKDKLSALKSKIPENTEKTSENIEKTNASISAISSLDFTQEKNPNTGELFSGINEKIEKLMSSSTTLITDSVRLANSLGEWTSANGTTYLNNLKSKLDALNSALVTGESDIMAEINTINAELDDILNEYSSKIDEAKNTNALVYNNLIKINENLELIKNNNELIKKETDSILNKINSIEITNIENIATPIITEINPVVKDSTNLGFMFPSLIVILVMFIGLFLSSSLIIMEKNSRAFFRVFTTPNKNRLFVISTYITSVLILFFQVLIIFLVTQFYFKIPLLNSFPILFLSLLFIMTFFVLLGMLIGYIFNSEEIAMLAAVSIGSIFLMTSGIIFPLESMPSYIIDKAKYNPLILSASTLKNSILLDSEIISIKSTLVILFVYSIIISLAILLIKKYPVFYHYFKKPFLLKQNRLEIMQKFGFSARKTVTLSDFILSIQALTKEKYNELKKENAFYEWLYYVAKNKKLAEDIKNIESKEELLSKLLGKN